MINDLESQSSSAAAVNLPASTTTEKVSISVKIFTLAPVSEQ
jgi:hypothetical protein